MKSVASQGRTVLRAGFLVTLVGALVFAAGCGGTHGSDSGDSGNKVTVTDAIGRKVTIPSPAKRVLLGGQRLLYTTAILNGDDPAKDIVGWPEDLSENDPDTYQKYAKKFPQIAKVSTTGEIAMGSLSAEQALRARPDVFVVSAASFKAAEDAGIVDKLQQADVPTVVVDYFTDPVRHTVPTIELLGQVFGRQEQARRFVDFYNSKITTVRQRLSKAHAAPTPVFLWRAPGYYDCCSTFAHSNLASLVDLAGGANLGDDLLSTAQGTLSPEAVLSHNAPVLIATGADWNPGKAPVKAGGYVALGYNEAPQTASSQWADVIAHQPGFGDLAAVRNHRAYAIWHHFYDSPYNYLAVEWFAKWLHPDLFGDIDPSAGLKELHQKFLPVGASGTFWTGLP